MSVFVADVRQKRMLLWLIIFCEVGFWVLLAAGLTARYLLQWPRVSAALLIGIPLIDLTLLVATMVDLSLNRATATFAHGLAAAYIGFTVVFGREIIRWADRWFAYGLASGERPQKLPAGGWPLIRYDLLLFGRAVLACSISAALIAGAIHYLADPEQTQALSAWMGHLFGTVVFWFVFGPLYTTVFKSRAPTQ
jgi:hypothetical protein